MTVEEYSRHMLITEWTIMQKAKNNTQEINKMINKWLTKLTYT